MDPSNCRIGVIRFMTGWRKTPVNQALVSLGVILPVLVVCRCCLCFMPPPKIRCRWLDVSFPLVSSRLVRLSIFLLTPLSRNAVLSGGVSVKLGQRSTVNAVMAEACIWNGRCGFEAHLFLCCDLVVLLVQAIS